jgi:hypothetical protein
MPEVRRDLTRQALVVRGIDRIFLAWAFLLLFRLCFSRCLRFRVPFAVSMLRVVV